MPCIGRVRCVCPGNSVWSVDRCVCPGNSTCVTDVDSGGGRRNRRGDAAGSDPTDSCSYARDAEYCGGRFARTQS